MKKVEIAAYLWNMSKTEKHIYICIVVIQFRD